MPEVTAEAWNRDVVGEIRRRLPVRFKSIRRGGWRHPFNHTLRYDADRDGWLYQIKPGFVNAQPVEIQTVGALSSVRTQQRLGREPGRDEIVDAWLTEHPEIPVPGTRAIGIGASATSTAVDSEGQISQAFEPVPEFFLDRGVYEPRREIESGFDIGIVETLENIPDDARLLRAFDTWLLVDRARAVVDWQFGTGLEGTVADFTVSYERDQSARDLAYIRDGAQFVSRSTPDFVDLLAGVVDDSSTDELKLATVYFMSLPGADPSEPTDETWTPFVAHDVFFNLNHATRNPIAPQKNEPIRLITGLAAGIGQPIIGSLLSQVNDFTSAARAAFAARQIDGRFWTT